MQYVSDVNSQCEQIFKERNDSCYSSVNGDMESESDCSICCLRYVNTEVVNFFDLCISSPNITIFTRYFRIARM